MKVVQTKGICGGYPRISGTRITVVDLLKNWIALGRDEDKLLSEYPSLKKGSVGVALKFAMRVAHQLAREQRKHDKTSM